MIMAQDLDDAAMKAVRIANIVKQVCFSHVCFAWLTGVAVDRTNAHESCVCFKQAEEIQVGVSFELPL